MNLYGYAGGDPINNSDPFGLCTPWPDCMFQAAANWGASRGGALGGAALNLAAAANAASEAFGTNDIGRAAGEGDVAGLAMAVVSVTPGGKLGKVGKVLDHIPATGRRANAAERRAVNEIGDRTGCHTCGATSSGNASGSWVPDHQPPTALAKPGEAQVLKPHCITCSRKQGGEVSQQVQKNPE